METKVCPICSVEKPVSEYHSYFSKERNKTRVGNYCKPCARENSKVRVKAYFEQNKEARLQYAKDYRANPENKEKLKTTKNKFKRKYIEKLQPCYVRDSLVQKKGFSNEDLHKNPEIVQVYTTQLKLKRTIKKLKDGKK